nr:hypothetical protein [Halomonas qijiaojingensis]
MSTPIKTVRFEVRLCEQVLKVAATLTVHARRVTVHLGAAADNWWPTLLRGLPRLGSLS